MTKGMYRYHEYCVKVGSCYTGRNDAAEAKKNARRGRYNIFKKLSGIDKAYLYEN